MQLLPLGRQQFFDNSGTPLAGGKVYFYEPGTTTPVDTWPTSDSSGTANPNPVILDSAGEAVIWGNRSYRQVVHDASDNPIWDEIVTASAPSEELAASGGAALVGFLQAGDDTVPRDLQQKGREIITPLDYTMPVVSGMPNATPATISAAEYFESTNGGRLDVSPTQAGYNIFTNTPDTQRGTYVTGRQNVDGHNATFNLKSNSEIWYIGREQDRNKPNNNAFGYIGTDAAVITKGTAATDDYVEVTLGTSSVFAIGDNVYIRLGQASYDPGEPAWYLFATITDITTDGTAADTITFDRPLGYALDTDATPNQKNRKIIKMTDLPSNVVFENARLLGGEPSSPSSVNAEACFFARYTQSAVFKNVFAHNPGAGALFQFCENTRLEGFYVDNSFRQGGSMAKGRGLGLAECDTFIGENINIQSCESTFIVVEGNCQNIAFRGVKMVNNFAGRATGDSSGLVALLGNADVLFENVHVTGNPAQLIYTSGTDYRRSGCMKRWYVGRDFTPQFDSARYWFRVDDVIEDVYMGDWFHFTRKQRFTLVVNLQASQYNKTFKLPNGVYTNITLMVSDKTGLTRINLADESTVNPVPNPPSALLASLVNGECYSFPMSSQYPFWHFGSDHPFTNPATPKVLQYFSDSNVPVGAYAVLEIDFFPIAIPSNEADIRTYMEVT